MTEPITIVMTTYDDGSLIRNSYAQRTHQALCQYIDYQPIKFHIASDGGSKPNLYLQKHSWPQTTTDSQRHGIGASLNLALSTIPQDSLFMYITDDWLLTRPLDLTPAIRLLTTPNDLHPYDLVRLGPLHPNLHCITQFNQDIGWYLDILDGPYRFATRPFLARNPLPPFPENLDSYATEKLYDETNKHLRIASYLSDGTEWEHIGDYNVGYLDPRRGSS